MKCPTCGGTVPPEMLIITAGAGKLIDQREMQIDASRELQAPEERHYVPVGKKRGGKKVKEMFMEGEPIHDRDIWSDLREDR